MHIEHLKFSNYLHLNNHNHQNHHNSNMNYHTGSIGAYALGDGLYMDDTQLQLDYLSTSADGLLSTASGDYIVVTIESHTGELNRQEIVILRKRIGDFLTNKSPKIIKDWNGNMWLVMFTSDIELSFVNDWGIVSLYFCCTYDYVVICFVLVY